MGADADLSRPTGLPPFRPTWWARGGHLQTVLGHLIPHPAPSLPTYDTAAREVLTLGDDELHLVRVRPPRSDARPVVVTLFHGLGGSTDADYVRGATARLVAEGRTVVAVNHRGCGEGAGRSSRPWHAGCRDDMAAVFRHVRGTDPDAVHVGVGFSLSANAILLLAAADPENAPDRVLAVHPPIDLERCSQVLSSGGNRVYDRRFVRVLQEWIDDAARAERLSPPTVPKGCTLRELDELFTAPAVGFPSRADYYAAASTHLRVQDIAAPTHVLSAADDPFVPRRMLESAPWSASTRLFVEQSGGHMGYLAAGRSRRWLDHAVAAHVTALLGDIGNSRFP